MQMSQPVSLAGVDPQYISNGFVLKVVLGSKIVRCGEREVGTSAVA